MLSVFPCRFFRSLAQYLQRKNGERRLRHALGIRRLALAARAGGRPTLPAAAAVEAVREGAAAAQAPTSALMSLLARIKAELQTRTRQPLRALALAFQQFASANVGGKGAEGMLTHLEAVAMLAVLLPEANPG